MIENFYSLPKKRWILISLILAVSLLGGAVLLSLRENKVSGLVFNQTSVMPSLTKINTPAPMPFAELTIPYLRNREYKSKLGELEKVSENGNYISYLTSYDSDGLKINGLLTQPEGDTPAGGWSAVIFIHGYIPPTQYRTLENYSTYVDYLARNGLSVFKIDLRGHANSEGDPGGAYYSPDYIVDALNAYGALQDVSFVNPKKIGLWGHSMAGNVVFKSVVVQKNIPAVVIWAGAVYSYEDLQKYRIQDGSYQPPTQDSERQRKRSELFATHGQFDPKNAFWQQVVPTNFLSVVTTAIQINHVVNDDVVNIGYSRDLMTILDKTSIRHELKEYSSGGHNISGSAFNEAMQNTIEFFKKNL